MVKVTWSLCFLATVMAAAAAASPAPSHGPKRSPSHGVPARSKGREFSGLQRPASFRSADVPRRGRSRVSRSAEARARRGVEDDPLGRLKGTSEATRLAVSKAIADLDALGKPQADAAKAEQPQAPASEAGKNRHDREVKDDRSAPPAGTGSQVGSEGNENSNSDTESSGSTTGAKERIPPSRAGGHGFSSAKTKYATSEMGDKHLSADAQDKDELILKTNDFASEGGNKKQFSAERNRLTPEESDRDDLRPKDNRLGSQPGTTNSLAPQGETKTNAFTSKSAQPATGKTSQAMKHHNQASVRPGEESSVTLGAEGSGAEGEGRNGTVSTEPLWLAWYNTHPWRQEMLSQYGEEARPSRTEFGL